MTDLDKKIDRVFNTEAGFSDTETPMNLSEVIDYFGDGTGVGEHQVREAIKHLIKEEVDIVSLGFASKADTEYSREELDSWIFSLGAIVHEAIIKAENQRNNYQVKGGGSAKP